MTRAIHCFQQHALCTSKHCTNSLWSGLSEMCCTAQTPPRNPVQARGLIESWLSNVEAHMRLTLKGLAKKALKDYSASRRPAWALAQPAQLALLATNIFWCQVGALGSISSPSESNGLFVACKQAVCQPVCMVCFSALNQWRYGVLTALQEVEAALQGSQGTASKQLRQLHGRCMLQLEDLVELIRGPLSDLERKVRRGAVSVGRIFAQPRGAPALLSQPLTCGHSKGLALSNFCDVALPASKLTLRAQAVVALITADVHNRDVVGSLIQKGTSSANDFAWQMQLRFEYDPDADSILVRQTGAR